MLSTKKIFLLILSLSLIFCQSNNKTEEKTTNDTTHNHTHEHEESSTDGNNTFSKRKPLRRDFNSKIPFNMTMDEMDTMIFCTLVVQEIIRRNRSKFEDLKTRLNVSANPVYEKIGTELFSQCNKNISISLVNAYMKNFTNLQKFKWEKEFDDIIKIDYNKYKNGTDLMLTMDEQFLMYKFQRVDELYRQKRADERDEYDSDIERENQKLKIGDIDVNSIPTSFKFLIFLVIIVLLFGGIFYLLKTLDKKPKDKKKKDKKKKQQ